MSASMYWNGYLAGMLTSLGFNFVANMALWFWLTRVKRS